MSNQLNPREILLAGLTALQITQYARAQQWEFPGDEELTTPPGRFGPLAEELAAIDPQLVASGSGIDTSTVAGLAWAAAAIAGDQIATLTTRVAELERQIAELA